MLSAHGNFLLLEPIIQKEETKKKTGSGLVIEGDEMARPDLAVAKGKVISVGEKTLDKWEVGAVVLYNFFSGNQYVVQSTDALLPDTTYHFVHETDILGVEHE